MLNQKVRPEQTGCHASRGVAPGFHFIKKSNSSGWCGGSYGNDLSDSGFRVHCTMTVYIDTSKSCDVPGTPNITDRFSCGLPSTTHTLLIQASTEDMPYPPSPDRTGCTFFSSSRIGMCWGHFSSHSPHSLHARALCSGVMNSLYTITPVGSLKVTTSL